MQTNTVNQESTWGSRIRALGPGILLASGAVGSSHLIASTQAGALYGWQLAIIILLANVLKYPFFRFSTHYTLKTGKSLIEGYAEKNRLYVWTFFILSIALATISSGAATLITAVIIKTAIPTLSFSVNTVAVLVMITTLVLLLFGHYRTLDRITKLIMISLTVTTVSAAVIAANRGMQIQPDFIEPSPWNMASLAFIIALMGWMPLPLEVTAINSMWITAKQKLAPSNYKDAMLDFNIGYVISTVLALVFLALGAFVQYGNGEPVEMVGGKYIGQLINMYAVTIGEWSRMLVAFIAFACMFGTALTVIDGYSRINAEASRLLLREKQRSNRSIVLWTCWSAFSGLAVILWFNSALAEMLRFAMISAFLTAPIFAWLNYSLVRMTHREAISTPMNMLAVTGLIYLTGFALVFILNMIGVLA